ncbi:lysozyme inhibitor LprI family protein [Myxococcaceae bacterium GXIMD 01537]
MRSVFAALAVLVTGTQVVAAEPKPESWEGRWVLGGTYETEDPGELIIKDVSPEGFTFVFGYFHVGPDGVIAGGDDSISGRATSTGPGKAKGASKSQSCQHEFRRTDKGITVHTLASKDCEEATEEFAACCSSAPGVCDFAPTNEAGFDCAKAATPTELGVCSVSDLRRADSLLQTLYGEQSRALGKDERERFKQEQRKWMASRDATCGKAKDVTVCLAASYRQRLAALLRPASKAPASAPFVLDGKSSEKGTVWEQETLRLFVLEGLGLSRFRDFLWAMPKAQPARASAPVLAVQGNQVANCPSQAGFVQASPTGEVWVGLTQPGKATVFAPKGTRGKELPESVRAWLEARKVKAADVTRVETFPAGG